MSIFFAIALGIVQGVGEFLPISSSGHLLLLNKMFGVESDFLCFSVMLHIATLCAIFIVLRKEVFFLIKHPFSKQARLICFATIPTVIIVLIFKSFFENAFSGSFLPFCFILTAFLLITTELLSRKKNFKKITTKRAIIIGIAQGIAVLPGVSRSGTTIATAQLMGINKQQASKFSFLLSVPIIIASMIYEILDVILENKPFFDVGLLPTIISFLTAFVVGIFSIKFMLKTFQKIKLWWFSIYLIIVGILSFLYI